MTVQDDIVAEFAAREDWLDKYQYLVALARELEPMPAELKSQKNLIPGCQSRTWLAGSRQDGRLYFQADSDAQISRGIIALLLRVLNGRTPREVANCDLRFIEQTGLSAHLSPARANGLGAIVEQMRGYAEAALLERGAQTAPEQQDGASG